VALSALLLKEVGARVQEGRGRVLATEVGDGRTEIRVEAAEDVDDESLTSDGGADVIESVGEACRLLSKEEGSGRWN
jgi:hypothetical protein